jgi:hypothetical protein
MYVGDVVVVLAGAGAAAVELLGGAVEVAVGAGAAMGDGSTVFQL